MVGRGGGDAARLRGGDVTMGLELVTMRRGDVIMVQGMMAGTSGAISVCV
jgi:hypothetical protein